MHAKVVRNWVEIADYDLETAKAMQQSGRYIYVAFTCQQSIEKLVKALFVKLKRETPPYTHNILRLVELTGIDADLSKDQADFLSYLNAYYIKTRYSESIAKLAKSINKKRSAEMLEQTHKLAKWLKAKIK